MILAFETHPDRIDAFHQAFLRWGAEGAIITNSPVSFDRGLGRQPRLVLLQSACGADDFDGNAAARRVVQSDLARSTPVVIHAHDKTAARQMIDTLWQGGFSTVGQKEFAAEPEAPFWRMLKGYVEQLRAA
jgi:hypothetical protein